MRIYYPVFTWMPDFSERPKFGTVAMQDRAGLAPARDTVFFPQTQADLTFGHNFTFLEAGAILSVKEFFRARCGRNEPFYFPSWRADLPGVSGASGSNLLTVVAPGYAAAHFGGGTHADNPGRQVFVWQPGEDLFTSAVVAATEGLHGHVELDLEGWLPFALNPKTAVIGFLHLMRFESDQIDWTHYAADAATVAIAFRGIRQWNGEGAEFTLEPITVHPPGSASVLHGFESAVISQEVANPPDSRVAYAFGPATLHTGSAFPDATLWVAWTNTDGIRLQKPPVPAYGQKIPDNAGTLTTLATGFVNTPHLALCFVTGGWEVIAYQRTAAAIRVTMKQFSGPVSYNFTGLDPLLFCTGQVDGTIGSGEDQVVACYYRKAGDNRLYARTSADSFAGEAVAALLPAKPLHLRQLYKSEDGRRMVLDYLDAGMRRVTLISTEYPAFP